MPDEIRNEGIVVFLNSFDGPIHINNNVFRFY